MQQWICARFHPHLGCGFLANNVNDNGFGIGEPGLLPEMNTVMAWCGDRHVYGQPGVVLLLKWQNETYCFFSQLRSF